MTLKQYEQNVYSQNGEDGIIGEIVKRLSIEEGYFIEFGAWDGKHLSNNTISMRTTDGPVVISKATGVGSLTWKQTSLTGGSKRSMHM